MALEVTVRFFALFRQYADPELVITLPSNKNTVADLIARLEEQLGDSFAREVGSEIAGNRQLQALVFVGNESIFNLQQLNTVLRDGDVVKFLPPMAGG